MTKRKANPKRTFTRVAWTADEEAYLRAHYPDVDTQTIANHLNRGVRGVYGKAHVMGLSKSPAFMASEASGRMQAPLHGGRAHWFKKGSVPFNKGRKGYCAPGSEKGHFKKGARPLNYLEIGTLRINTEGYIDIKLQEGKRGWWLLSRYNWFLHTGHWPTHSEAIWYRNGDKHDCEFANLELITRKEHMLRTTVHRYPKEVVQMVQLRGALNRAINRVHKQQTTQSQGASA